MRYYVVQGLRICPSSWKSRSRTFKAHPVVKGLPTLEISAPNMKAALRRARKRYGAKRGCRLKLHAVEV